MTTKETWIPWEGPTHGTIKRGPHQMTKRVLHWPYCARCGLVALKNEVSRKAIKSDCIVEE